MSAEDEYQQFLRREAEKSQLAINLAFSNPDACRLMAAKIWAWLSQISTISFNVIYRYKTLKRNIRARLDAAK